MAILNNSEVVDRTSAIERIPFENGLIGSLGLYRTEVIRTDTLTFDVRENSFAILDDHLRNVAQKNSTSDVPFKMHTLPVPHYPVVKTLGREKLAGVRGFDKESEVIIGNAIASELEVQATRHDVHEEYLKAQMTVNGIVVTNNYGTFNMATEFGVARPSQVVNPTSVLVDLQAAMSTSKANLKTGGRVAGYVLLASPAVWNALIQSPDVAQAYQFSQSGMNPLRNELGTVANGYSMFRFGNIDIVLYDDAFQDKDGNTLTVLEDGKGVLVPRTQLGAVVYAPASTLSGLGKVGSKRFAQTYRDPKDRFVEVESEQSTLVINEQFSASVEITLV